MKNKFKQWLNTAPSQDDWFFTNIRRTYQEIKKVPFSKKDKQFMCRALYTFTLLSMFIDVFLIGMVSTSFIYLGLTMTVLLNKLYRREVRNDKEDNKKT